MNQPSTPSVRSGAMSQQPSERVQSSRKISSTILDEQFIGPPPEDYPTREVEVRGPVQEIIKHVPRKEVIEIEKRVPKYEIEYVDRVVEVPRVMYRDSVREVPVYKDVFVDKPVPQIVNVPKEVIQERRVPRVNYVEEVRQVPGEIIEVAKPYTVEQKVEITRYTDHKRPVVVAQTVKPVIVEGHGVTEVDVYEYEPEIIPVDVHVMKGVETRINANGVVESEHRVVSVPAAQYNTILQQLNAHLPQNELVKLPYLTENGQITSLNQPVIYSDVTPGALVHGFDATSATATHLDYGSRRYASTNVQPTYQQPTPHPLSPSPRTMSSMSYQPHPQPRHLLSQASQGDQTSLHPYPAARATPVTNYASQYRGTSRVAA